MDQLWYSHMMDSIQQANQMNYTPGKVNLILNEKKYREYVQYNTFSIKLKPTEMKIHTLQNTFRRELFFKVNEKKASKR